MKTPSPRLVLGSASPRRADLLAQIGLIPDIVQPADIDETPRPNEKPDIYCTRVAREKNAVLATKFPDDFIITADTTVAVGRRILGKPDNRDDAKRMINLLSGRAHNIHTALVIHAPGGKTATRLSSSRVKVKRLTEAEIEAFLDTSDWVDAAGAYKLQKSFARFIIHVSGSPSGIIGLPLFETAQLLAGLGFHGMAR
jgi:septum formation protein